MTGFGADTIPIGLRVEILGAFTMATPDVLSGRFQFSFRTSPSSGRRYARRCFRGAGAAVLAPGASLQAAPLVLKLLRGLHLNRSELSRVFGL